MILFKQGGYHGRSDYVSGSGQLCAGTHHPPRQHGAVYDLPRRRSRRCAGQYCKSRGNLRRPARRTACGRACHADWQRLQSPRPRRRHPRLGHAHCRRLRGYHPRWQYSPYSGRRFPQRRRSVRAERGPCGPCRDGRYSRHHRRRRHHERRRVWRRAEPLVTATAQ